MSQELATLQGSLAPSKYATTANLQAISKSSSYLPYLQLLQASSGLTGTFPAGSFVLTAGKSNNIDLGKEFIALPLSWRPKVMDFNEMISAYNPATELFKKMQAKAGIKQSGCGAGPEILLWFPEHDAFGGFFMSSPSAQLEANNLIALIGRPVLVKSDQVQNRQKQRFYVPICSAYDVDIKLPPQDENTATIVNGFNNPTESDIELADKPADGADR